jgi:hypothetical protein
MDSLVEIVRTQRLEADLLRSVLEGSGIDALVSGYANEAYPVTVGGMAEVGILVRSDDAERALEVIREARSGGLELEEP